MSYKKGQPNASPRPAHIRSTATKPHLLSGPGQSVWRMPTVNQRTIESKMEIRRLNTLRGIAALIVVVSHFSNASGLWGTMLGGGAGQFGVMLFFLLSGFLMTYLYWDKQPTSPNVISYAVSRIARVVPLYWLVVSLSVATPYFYNIESYHDLASHLLFLHGKSVLWTIPPEIQFYVLFGLGWLFVSKKRTLLPLILSIVFISTFVFNYRDETTTVLDFPVANSIIKAIPYFVTGCILGGLYNKRDLLSPYLSHWYLITFLLIPMLYPKIFIVLFGFKHGMWEDIGILLIIAMAFFCLVFLVPDRNPILENKAGDFFGKISYSLYLLHLPVLSFLTSINCAKYGVLSLVAFIALASTSAWVSYTLIEAPSRQVIRRILAQQTPAGDIQSASRPGRL